MDSDRRKLLGIYLNDHLALLIGSERLAGRCRSSNSGQALAGYLGELSGEIRTDVNTVRRILTSIDAKESKMKVLAAGIGEKLGRLKLNGRLTGYSPLSRVVELQHLGLLRKAAESLWASLKLVKDLSSVDEAKLQERLQAARNSQARLDEFLAESIPAAFGQ